MSLAVKILLILNLVLAMVVAVVTMVDYSTSENWKRRWDSDSKQLKAQLDDSANQITQLSIQRSTAEASKIIAEAEIARLNATKTELQTAVTEKAAEITRLSQELSQKSTEIASLRDKVESLTSSLELARQNASEQRSIAQVARGVVYNLNVKLHEVEDDLNNTKAKLTQAEQEFSALTTTSNKDKAKLALLRQRYPKVAKEMDDEGQSSVFLQGVVAAVKLDGNNKQDLVILTVGGKDKVEEGTEFTVFRGDKYIVRVRVIQVLNDMVSCRVIPDSWNTSNLEIKQGDNAQNRL